MVDLLGAVQYVVLYEMRSVITLKFVKDVAGIMTVFQFEG